MYQETSILEAQCRAEILTKYVLTQLNQGWLDDEPLEIDDPDHTKPENWDEEHGGEWTPRKIDNPKCEDGGCGVWKPPLKMNPNYRGKWKAPLIKNPNYQGVWRAREIPNPEYVAITKPHFELIGAIGIDLWTMDGGIMFDNILITHNESVARDVREKHWKPKFDAEVKQIAAENEEKQYHNILKAPSTIKVCDWNVSMHEQVFTSSHFHVGRSPTRF